MNKFVFNFSYCVQCASVTALDFVQHLCPISISIGFMSFFSLACVPLRKQVYDSSVIAYPQIVHPHGLITTVLGLHMQLDSSHFADGLMRVKCLTSVSPLLNAAEARESSHIEYNGNNRKTNYAQRKSPLTDSREVFLLGKCTSFLKKRIPSHLLHDPCTFYTILRVILRISLFHCSLLCHLLGILRSLEFGSQPLISFITLTFIFTCFHFFL